MIKKRICLLIIRCIDFIRVVLVPIIYNVLCLRWNVILRIYGNILCRLCTRSPCLPYTIIVFVCPANKVLSRYNRTWRSSLYCTVHIGLIEILRCVPSFKICCIGSSSIINGNRNISTRSNLYLLWD